MKDEELVIEIKNKLSRAKDLEKEFLDITEDSISCKFLNEFISKIVCGYIVSKFSDAQLQEIAELDEREDVDNLLYSFACLVDDEPLSDVLEKLESKYPDSWKV